MVRAYLGLGANLGDRARNMREALRALGGGGCGARVVAVSSLYESPALVPEGEPAGPPYFNAVCEVDTELSARELLALAKDIERALGRTPGKRWGDRPIDIDVLTYGDHTIDTPDLRVPHPAMHLRNFVLIPLAEIAPAVMHPTLGRTIADLALHTGQEGLHRIAGPEWATGTS
jgi:2-amino-4-hydroxy-6-hydroxymethyldihydropteridine diphosphokinase